MNKKHCKIYNNNRLYNDTSKQTAVIADIGGTNTRFAMVDEEGSIFNHFTIKTNDYPDVVAAYNAYLEILKLSVTPKVAVFAFAGNLVSDEISLLNAKWSFSILEVGDKLNLDYFSVVNDFVAQALSIPTLTEEEKLKISDYGQAIDNNPIAVIGAGTGLGVAYLVPTQDSFIAIPSEAGHQTAAGITEKEKEVINYLSSKYNHISFERLVSGMGLENIYKALSFINKGEEQFLDSITIYEKALAGDELSEETFEMFFSYLGIIASNLAISSNAMSGIYLSGGILNDSKVIEMLKQSKFRERFNQKGRLSSFVESIETYVIVAENVALQGLANIIVNYFKKSS